MPGRNGQGGQLIKCFIYDLPEKFKHRPHEATLLSETYDYLFEFFKRYRTHNPYEADVFLVPVNLVQFQFRGENPRKCIKHLEYLHLGKPTFIIALGDFSQRTSMVNFGAVYKKPYKWLASFNLLALESSSDLIDKFDIAVIPTNCLVEPESEIYSPLIERKFLWSFLGTTKHRLLPETHIRNKVTKSLGATVHPEGFVGDCIDLNLRAELEFSSIIEDDFELMARNSTFTISPAGYGSWTYRFFQAIKWGSIPVLLSDPYIPPFSSQIPWDKISIRIPESKFSETRDILNSFTKPELELFNENLANYRDLFTPEKFEAMLMNELSIFIGKV